LEILRRVDLVNRGSLGLLLLLSVLTVSGCARGHSVVIDIPNVEVDINPPDGVVSVQVPDVEVDVPDLRIGVSAAGVIRGSGNVIAETRLVNDFNRVSLTGVGDVIITQGERESLVVETDDNIMRYIKSEVRNGTLVLGFADEVRSNEYKLDPSEIRFNLMVKEISGLDVSGVGYIQIMSYYAGELELQITGVADIVGTSLNMESLEIVINGVANIDVSSVDANRADIVINGVGEITIGSLTANEYEASLNGTGGIDINSLTARNSMVYIRGVGDVELTGEVDEQVVYISGVGDYFAAELESQTGMVEVDGGPNTVTVWVVEKLDVSIYGRNTVKYYGSPHVDQEISNLGMLIHLGRP
jgi:hypothetical protein